MGCEKEKDIFFFLNQVVGKDGKEKINKRRLL